MNKTESYVLGAETYGDEIVRYLLEGKKVIIDSGCVNDEIISYEEYNGKYAKHVFTSTACIFPKQFVLTDFKYISSEEYNDILFVHVM